MSTLADELPKQMARVRDEVVPAYQAIGPAGTFALTCMRNDLDLAAKAMVSGDLVAMITACKSLQEYKL
jgi:hypothetical protein